MKKRIAIPVTNEQLSEYFGHCSYYEIFEIEGSLSTRSRITPPLDKGVFDLSLWLSQEGVTDVVTHKVASGMLRLFASKKVNLFVGVAIDTPENLIDAYLQGKLESDEKIIREIHVTN